MESAHYCGVISFRFQFVKVYYGVILNQVVEEDINLGIVDLYHEVT